MESNVESRLNIPPSRLPIKHCENLGITFETRDSVDALSDLAALLERSACVPTAFSVRFDLLEASRCSMAQVAEVLRCTICNFHVLKSLRIDAWVLFYIVGHQQDLQIGTVTKLTLDYETDWTTSMDYPANFAILRSNVGAAFPVLEEICVHIIAPELISAVGSRVTKITFEQPKPGKWKRHRWRRYRRRVISQFFRSLGRFLNLTSLTLSEILVHNHPDDPALCSVLAPLRNLTALEELDISAENDFVYYVVDGDIMAIASSCPHLKKFRLVALRIREDMALPAEPKLTPRSMVYLMDTCAELRHLASP
jgi:hypothetical protein